MTLKSGHCYSLILKNLAIIHVHFTWKTINHPIISRVAFWVEHVVQFLGQTCVWGQGLSPRMLTENMRMPEICFNCVWIPLEGLLIRTRNAMFILVGIDANEIVHHGYRICWEVKVSVRTVSLHQEQRTAAESFDTSHLLSDPLLFIQPHWLYILSISEINGSFKNELLPP